MNAAWAAYPDWSRLLPAERARVLFKAAALLRRQKHVFSATMVYEAGKTWPEADADTAEAIDFLEYYGREALRLAEPPRLPRIAGEDNDLAYLPLGVGVVIPPWNFPLAITVGMTAAAIVTGNTVLLKPASATPVIAARFVELLETAGLPSGVVNFVPGSGADIGDFLVAHPQTRFVSFTGSREVGTHIYALAAQVQPGQRWLKRVVAEMGGKDAVIVDDTADLDAAAEGITASAYGFQGQKCSAASRAIVLDGVYQDVLGRVASRAEALKQGPAEEPTSQIAAVIDESQYRKVLGYMEVGQREGRLVIGGESDGDEGWYIQPTIFADLPADGRMAQEEIFGPVLVVRACARLRPRAGDREQHRVRADGWRVLPRPPAARASQGRVPRRQPVSESQDHRRARGRPTLWRLQHERNRLQSGRPRLPATVPSGQGRRRAVLSQAARELRSYPSPMLGREDAPTYASQAGRTGVVRGRWA